MALTLEGPNEEFWRCPECNNPYFEIKEVSTIEKDSLKAYTKMEDGRPRVLDTKTILVCANEDCKQQYSRKDLVIEDE